MVRKLLCCVCITTVLLFTAMLPEFLSKGEKIEFHYPVLREDKSSSEPLAHLNEEYYADSLFSSNLPIVILTLEEVPPIYKYFKNGNEVVDDEVEPWVRGTISVISADTHRAYINAEPMVESNIRIKRRGHTSMSFDKPQFYIKTVDASSNHKDVSFLQMGQGSRWVLCGSMADKSMLRNYLAYRVSWEIGGGSYAPECRFCEVFTRTGSGKPQYMGVYLLQSAVSQGESRINIPDYNPKNKYTGYILRRDRYTSFDPMLETFGRLHGFTDTWIGLKYPSGESINDEIISYITEDFSETERVIYSDNQEVFQGYKSKLNLQSFVDYFLINEYFGNYDAGLHSTYYFKSPGGKLNVGPVWDFDQGMNNYYREEMNPESIAFQTRTFYEQLVKDRAFVKALKKRYAVLRRHYLSDSYMELLIEEAQSYLRSARMREWYRWKDDYEDPGSRGGKNYVLKPYYQDGEQMQRFNTDYAQEIRVIKVYLHRHGAYIQEGLTNLLHEAVMDSSISAQGVRFFILLILTLFMTGIIVLRRI